MLGTRVRSVETGVAGTVRYVGEVGGQRGEFYGVEWDQPVGKYDGSYEGVVYFTCSPKHGSFVKRRKLSFGTPLWETIRAKYVRTTDSDDVSGMTVTDGVRETAVRFFGQQKLDRRHQDVSRLTEIDLQGSSVSTLGDPLALQQLRALTTIELSFTLLNDPHLVLELFLLLPRLETVLVNGCNVRWDQLLLAEKEGTGGPRVGWGRSLRFVALCERLRRERGGDTRLTIYANAPEGLQDCNPPLPFISSHAFHALVDVPRLTRLHCDFWCLETSQLYFRRPELAHLSLASSFGPGTPLTDVLDTLSRAFPHLVTLALPDTTGTRLVSTSLSLKAVERHGRICPHLNVSLKSLNLHGVSLQPDALRFIDLLHPNLEEIWFSGIEAGTKSERLLSRDTRAHAVSLLGERLRQVNWEALGPEDRDSEERYYVQQWLKAAQGRLGEALLAFYRASPEVPRLLLKHQVEIPRALALKLIEVLPTNEVEETLKPVLSEAYRPVAEVDALDEKYGGKVMRVLVEGVGRRSLQEPLLLLLPRSTQIWRLRAILNTKFQLEAESGRLGAAGSCWGEDLARISPYSRLDDVIGGTECRLVLT